MRVLLIGGSGFIGQRVVAWLQQRGHYVLIFHRGETGSLSFTNAPRIHGNRLEIDKHIEAIMQARPDVVIDFLPWNDTDTQRVVNTLAGRVEHVIHLSSSDVYRAWGYFLDSTYGEPVPLDEQAPLRDKLYPYAGTRPGMEYYDKILAERVILSAHYDEGYPGTIIRLPVIYGPGDPQHRVWRHVKRMHDGRSAILLGCCQAAWLWQRGYVDDIAFGIALAAERPASIGQIYNIGSPGTITVASWVKAIGDVMGWDGEIVLIPDDHLPPHLQTGHTYQQHFLLNTTKIRRELGYSEQTNFVESLRKTVEWQVEYPPTTYDETRFNYAAEDAALKEWAGV